MSLPGLLCSLLICAYRIITMHRRRGEMEIHTKSEIYRFNFHALDQSVCDSNWSRWQSVETCSSESWNIQSLLKPIGMKSNYIQSSSCWTSLHLLSTCSWCSFPQQKLTRFYPSFCQRLQRYHPFFILKSKNWMKWFCGACFHLGQP